MNPSAYIRCDHCAAPVALIRSTGDKLTRVGLCVEHGAPYPDGYTLRAMPSDATGVRFVGFPGSYDDALELAKSAWRKTIKRGQKR